MICMLTIAGFGLVVDVTAGLGRILMLEVAGLTMGRISRSLAMASLLAAGSCTMGSALVAAGAVGPADDLLDLAVLCGFPPVLPGSTDVALGTAFGAVLAFGASAGFECITRFRGSLSLGSGYFGLLIFLTGEERSRA